MEAAECRSEAEVKEIVYKTKIVQFLGRSTPIILQNENGPCPLLAICNALLLRNNINLSVDEPEVPQQKLLSLVADRLIGSNSNVQDKDFGYLINQQQNIADAIDLLPRLATGIDVNVQFRKINDFEFTRECTIFDLLDIGLYHGWIVDPQDSETASAVGTKSYNTLAGELVAFEAKKFEMESKKISDADSVDFVAATTAVLGVPSPSLSRGRSFDSCPDTVSSDQIVGKGDREESEELLMVLNLSRDEVSCPASDSVSADTLSQQEATPILTSTSEVSSSSFMHQDEVDSKTIDLLDKAAEQECRSSKNLKDNALSTEAVSIINDSLLPIVDVGSNAFQSTDNSDKSSSYVEGAYLSGETVHSTPFDAISQPNTDVDDIAGRHASANVVDLDRQVLNFERKELLNVPEIASGLDISEPLYEGKIVF
ncbi:hypothetical protein HPP92_021682 [Vanilla planifolia]|uniref:MINDY deubiquitinase domain-containing protein n=1 Tax=Vanilla planifolia TaxID=51239 RepID=A0A835PZ54_VANPL|nr:hypothetical protein HPP92_021682 [Vanilla planifolia]